MTWPPIQPDGQAAVQVVEQLNCCKAIGESVGTATGLSPDRADAVVE